MIERIDEMKFEQQSREKNSRRQDVNFYHLWIAENHALTEALDEWERAEEHSEAVEGEVSRLDGIVIERGEHLARIEDHIALSVELWRRKFDELSKERDAARALADQLAALVIELKHPALELGPECVEVNERVDPIVATWEARSWK